LFDAAADGFLPLLNDDEGERSNPSPWKLFGLRADDGVVASLVISVTAEGVSFSDVSGT